MEIRPPNKPNYAAIAEMLSKAMGRPWDAENLMGRIMADPFFDPNLVLMAREKGEVLGFLSTVLTGSSAWLKLIAVAPQARGKGLGREMLERAIERLFGEGARELRAGFSPPGLFYPGVPEGPALHFFEKLGFVPRPGGMLAEILDPGSPAPRADAKAAQSLMQSVEPQWWSEVEERLSFSQPRLSLSADGTALCLADPALSIGPLFFKGASEASIREAVLGARAIGGPKVLDSRGPEWWQPRFKLEKIARCFEYQKDLKGDAHA